MQIKLFCFNVMFNYLMTRVLTGPAAQCLAVRATQKYTDLWRSTARWARCQLHQENGCFDPSMTDNSYNTSETMQASSLRRSNFPSSATRCREWRYWLTMGPFIMETVTSSGRRWAGCWAWRQRRSAAGRRPEKPWRSGREKSPWTPWYVSCAHRIWSNTTYQPKWK